MQLAGAPDLRETNVCAHSAASPQLMRGPLGTPRSFMRLAVGFVKSVALYLAIVIGGLTLFLVLAPLFGLLSDNEPAMRSFPAIGWAEFWDNFGRMVEVGLFLVTVLVLPGVLCVLAIRGLERVTASAFVVRFGGSLISALATGYWMFSANWYIGAGLPVLILAICLGALAGAWSIPRRPTSGAQGA